MPHDQLPITMVFAARELAEFHRRHVSRRDGNNVDVVPLDHVVTICCRISALPAGSSSSPMNFCIPCRSSQQTVRHIWPWGIRSPRRLLSPPHLALPPPRFSALSARQIYCVLPAFDGALWASIVPMLMIPGPPLPENIIAFFHSCSSPLFLSRSTTDGNCLSVFSSMNFQGVQRSHPPVRRAVGSSAPQRKTRITVELVNWNARFIARFAS